MVDCRVLLVTYPGQGHINPSLQFAKRLVKSGIQVTFVTSVMATKRMTKASVPPGIELAPFSHGYDEGFKSNDDIDEFISSLEVCGGRAVAELITGQAEQGRPFTRVIYTTLFPWVGKVANELNIPSTLLWIQPAALFAIYFYHFDGLVKATGDDADTIEIELPGLPLLRSSDLPSFLLPSSPDIYNFALRFMKEHMKVLLQQKTTPRILVNTFDSLEHDALRAIDKFKFSPIGPLIPSAFLDGKDPSDTCFGGDLFQKTSGYVEWLNSKPDSSVVYVAFGSLSEFSRDQMEEIAQGLLQTRRPFLWVIRPAPNSEKEEERFSCSCTEELEKQGLVVPWCSQVEVLSHPSIGCFVTHCGWNSSLESLASGVPVVGFPQWTDQATNAKFIQDVWKTGVRVRTNDEGFAKAAEISRCIEIIIGGEEAKQNAKKWRDLAKEAMKEDGTSNLNLKAFLDELGSQ